MQRFTTHILSSLVLLFLFGSSFAYAGSTYINPITYGGITTIPCFLLALVDLVFLIGVPIIVLFIIYAGFLFVTAGGNESQIEKAKTSGMWCLIGGLILLGAKAIALAIQNTALSVGAVGAAGAAC